MRPEDVRALSPPVVARSLRFRPTRRALAALAVGVVIVAAAAIAYASGAFGGGAGATGGGTADNTFPTSLARVMRRSLSQQTQVSATLGYAGASTIVVPAGTAPTSVTQAQQAVTLAQSQLQTAQAALVTDSGTLATAGGALSAEKAKLSVDCAGANAGESPASSAAGGGGAGAGACANDSQVVSTDEQSVSQSQAKVATDRQAVSSASTGLASAETSLTQAESSAAAYGQSSTYTELPAVGQIVKRGGTLFELSGSPTVLLYGSVAPWRTFAAGMAPGKDVGELNANLRALGYGSGLSGDAFGAATTSAIDAFQAAHGLTRSGELLLGSVVVEPGPVRVTTVSPTLGATVQPGPVLGITSLTRQVTIELDAAQQAEVKVGDPVEITLPDNSTTPGRVSYVGTVATAPASSGQGGGDSGAPTIEVDVTPTDPTATGHLDQAPVNVSITESTVKNALVVPVNALLALANGGYALEEVGAGDSHHLVGVGLGLFDDQDGLVQVTGAAIAAGRRVVVPSE